MAFVVNVDSYADFIKWWQHQLQPAPRAANAAGDGRLRIMSRQHQCSACHNIAGTPASGTFGPDLTHFASRRTIAAGTMPMSEGNLYGWVADPQSHQARHQMPTIGLEPDELHAVVAYLRR